jgi:aryl-alcohol dehydrogenase-like predicted oxidoreductase
VTTYRRVGKSGLTVSTVGLGCNNLGRANTPTESQEATDAVVHAAVDAGITLFDVADTYGREPGLSETMLGKALGSRRAAVVVATKFGMDMKGASGPDFGARGSRRYIIQAVEASLRRLGTDWIDLYQFHTPDPLTPIDETLSALDALVTSGKVRYIGHSNRAGWQIAQAEYVARELGAARFISTQNHYNLLDRRAELEVTPAAEEFGLGVLPYFPLANGLLTGKYAPGHARTARGSATPASTWSTTPTGTSWAGSAALPGNAAERDPGRLLLAGSPAVRRQRHRRRHQAGTGAAERRSSGLDSLRKGPRGAGQHFPCSAQGGALLGPP